MPVDTYAINGTAFVYVGTGSAGALQLLGYTEQGVDVDTTENKTEIMTDLFGDKTPQDFQDMGMITQVIIPLIAYDTVVMQQVLGRGDRTVWGGLNTPGIALGQSGYGFPVSISAPLATGSAGSAVPPAVPLFANAAPLYFYKCLTRRQGARLATKANPYRLELIAWPWASYTATTGRDAPLFRRGNP